MIILNTVLVLCTMPLPAQSVGGTTETIFEFSGRARGAELGFCVADAGDVNNDGVRDLLTGSPQAYSPNHGHAGSAHVASGVDGSIIYKWNGQRPNDRFGTSVASAGDVNADGFSDLIVGARSADPNGRSQAGSVFVYSGANGSVLYQKDGVTRGDHFGSSVSGAGDANNDGFDDFLVGATDTGAGGIGRTGSAYLYSGFDGSLLQQWDGHIANTSFGFAVSPAGDLNGDGFADQLVGAIRDGPISNGSVTAFSGADGSVIYIWRGVYNNGSFGRSVSGLGDVNGDGVNDVIIGSAKSSLGNTGSVFVYSGADFSLLYIWEGTTPATQGIGASVSHAGDVNGDGFADVIAGASQFTPGGPSPLGAAFLFSGADGSLLKQFDGILVEGYFGSSVAGLGDVNADGLDDVAVGAPGNYIWGAQGGAAYVYSFQPFLTASTHTVSAASGGTLQCNLDFPIEAAADEYKILISGSGIGPTTFGVDIPLTQDSLVVDTFQGNYPFTSYSNLHGTLNASGSATASITLPAGLPPGLIGRTFWLAAIANQPGQLPEYSSVAVPIEITP